MSSGKWPDPTQPSGSAQDADLSLVATMEKPIHHMSVIRYYRDRSGWDEEQIIDPEFGQIETAIRRMDNLCFPVVDLNPSEYEDDTGILHIVGGDGRFAVASLGWRFEDPLGANAEVALWESDQGYFTKQKNVLTDIHDVLALARVFAQTSSHAALQQETERILGNRARSGPSSNSTPHP